MVWTRILGPPALAGVVLLMGCGNGSGPVTLNLTVNTIDPFAPSMSVPNAEVCVLDTEDCATTNTDGLAVLMLPGNAETGVTITAAGFNVSLLALHTDADFVSDQATVVLSETVAAQLSALLEVDYPPVGTGVIGLGMLFPPPDGGGVPGATYELIDGTGTGFYNDADGLPSYVPMATSSLGQGGFVLVPPGVVEIDIGGAGNCGGSQAWPGTTATSIRLPVQDGVITFSTQICETLGVTATVNGAEVPFGDPVPLEGAEVCQDGTDNCAMTNADGEATLQIPGNVEFAYAVTPPSDYFPTLNPQVSDSNISVTPGLTVFLDSLLEGFGVLLETDWPPTTTGTVAIPVFENPFPLLVGLPGVSFELIEGTGVPFYQNESNLPSKELTETQDNGGGGFIEVSEGTIEVGLAGAENCDPSSAAWPGAEPTQFRMPSRAGFLTVPVFWCDAAE